MISPSARSASASFQRGMIMDNVQPAAETAAQPAIIERSAGGEGALTPMQAARSLADTRFKDQAAQRRNDDEQAGEARQDATAQQESTDGEKPDADTARANGPGETPADDAEAGLPPIEPPRSWTKDDKELFKGLPRATQERLAERERSRERDFLRRQTEDAEKLKGLTAKEQQAEQVRLQYEGKLNSVVEMLEKEQLREFPDIRSQADLDKMVADMVRLANPSSPDADPFEALRLQGRLAGWNAHQQKLQAAHHELQQAE